VRADAPCEAARLPAEQILVVGGWFTPKCAPELHGRHKNVAVREVVQALEVDGAGRRRIFDARCIGRERAPGLAQLLVLRPVIFLARAVVFWSLSSDNGEKGVTHVPQYTIRLQFEQRANGVSGVSSRKQR
jgi:hypothetical protein